MAIPSTVDIPTFYGEPDFREQDSGTNVDGRKTLNLHKELETPINTPSKKRRPKRTTTKSAGATGFGLTKSTSGGAFTFNGAGCKTDGAIGFKDTGGALAFNEQQLMNALTGLKKGGALGTIVTTVIPALIQRAPQIISSIKDLIKGKQGGALKFDGASAVFLNGIDLSVYDDVLKTMKANDRQSKKPEVRSEALYAGSSRVGTFFRNAWNKIKSWYGNNAEKLKPITDILVKAGTNAANNAINKGVNYVSNKTGSNSVKQSVYVVGNMTKDGIADVANQILGKDEKTSGSGYDISDLDNETNPIEVPTKKKNRILTALPQNENKIHKSIIRRRVY